MSQWAMNIHVRQFHIYFPHSNKLTYPHLIEVTLNHHPLGDDDQGRRITSFYQSFRAPQKKDVIHNRTSASSGWIKKIDSQARCFNFWSSRRLLISYQYKTGPLIIKILFFSPSSVIELHWCDSELFTRKDIAHPVH